VKWTKTQDEKINTLLSVKFSGSKSDATRCQILRLKCNKFNFRWGSVPDPAGGAYNAPPDSLAVLKAAYF